MILPNFKDFDTKHRLLGIDWGMHRTGVAVSCDDGAFVFARPVISMSKYDADILAKHIVKIAIDEGINGIVIGLPLRTDGSESDTTKKVREFAEVLSQETDLPIVFIDETLTSTAAQEQMGRVTRHDIKNELDSNSARVILENAIELIKRG